MMSQRSGGWPLTIVMMPDRRPFFAATYIPKEGRWGRQGLVELIPRLRTIWETRRGEVEKAAAETGSVLVPSGQGPATDFALRATRQLVVIPRGRHDLSLAQALELVRCQPTGMVTMLTGPSRTADIEKVLVLGAQGPGELDLVLYQPEA